MCGAFVHENAMNKEGMGTYPGYIERMVSEARDGRTNVEFETSPETTEAAD